MNARCLLSAVVLFLISSLVVFSPSFAEASGGYKFNTVTIGSGDDPISSGICAVARLSNQKNSYLEFTLMSDQFWVVYGPQFKKGRLEGMVTGSIGYLQDSPWIGPLVALRLNIAEPGGIPISVGMVQWPVFFGYEPRDWRHNGQPDPDVLVGYYQSASLGIGPVEFSYSLLNFLEDPWNELPGVSYTARIQDNVSVFGSLAHNGNERKWMVKMGVNWTFSE